MFAYKIIRCLLMLNNKKKKKNNKVSPQVNQPTIKLYKISLKELKISKLLYMM